MKIRLPLGASLYVHLMPPHECDCCQGYFWRRLTPMRHPTYRDWVRHACPPCAATGGHGLGWEPISR